MIGAYSADQVRAAERPALAAGMGAELMSRAAFAVAQQTLGLLRSQRGRLAGSRAVALVGKGNNGGDGLWTLTFLARRGLAVTALLMEETCHREGLAALRAAGGTVLWLSGAPGPEDGAASPAEARALCLRSDVVIDAILGTGARGGLRGLAAELVSALAEDQRVPGYLPPVVACDIPSGVDAGTGECSGPVLRATLTVTFVGAKAGLFLPPGAQSCGRISVVPLGVEAALGEPLVRRLESEDLGELLPRPSANGHKYTRGVLGVVAGSEEYPGAAVLACSGALAAGAGMVRYYGPPPVAALVSSVLPEVVCHSGTAVPGRVQAWLLGPGVSGGEQLARCRAALAQELPTVLDAGALHLLNEGIAGRADLVLTPHAGELAELLGRFGQPRERSVVEARALDSLRDAVRLSGCTVLLKGPQTLTGSPDGAIHSQADGTPWLATAGSGDVLAGVLGALLAQAPPSSPDAETTEVPGRWARVAALAAAVHGRAGRIATGESSGGSGRPVTARDVARAVPLVWDETSHDRSPDVTSAGYGEPSGRSDPTRRQSAWRT
ncbi:NAD(P)H-hydrate epimerase [Arthrobacter sp. NPDC090010]|uniref:NAD(P)H-hydrate epimerase n=1 Tax=Arthrobacter sp. NPDC090010 TaxID=3363942 RepID=UPI003802F92A